MKTCIKCNQYKELSAFYQDAKMADGHLNRCRECLKAYRAKHRQKNLEQIRAYDRQRGLTDEYKERQREYRKRLSEAERKRRQEFSHEWRAKNPEKYIAHYTAGNAIRTGHITPMPCRDCGSSEHIHAHHEDYSEPLEITWLCRTCHGKHHRRYA
jgi:hypothetical protein